MGDTPATRTPLRVCVSGGIGAGKTYLSQRLSDKLGYSLCEEPVEENPYLADFYKDKAKYSFPCQVAFLASRFSQLAQILAEHGKSEGIVMDRSAHEDIIFARLLFDSKDMHPRDFLTYMKLFDCLTANLGNNLPDIILYLDVRPSVLMKRIEKRGRDCEQSGGVDKAYLESLQAQYENYIEEMARRTTVFRVEWNTFRTADEVWEAVEAQYTAKNGVFTLEF